MHPHENLMKLLGPEAVLIAGRFFPAAAGAITYPAGDKHRGWAVARSGVGVALLTLNKKYPRIISLLALTIQTQAAGVAMFPQWGLYVQANRTIEIRNLTNAAAAVEFAAANGDYSVSFALIAGKTLST